ncbi:MAG: type I methionyl aminopeptidase [Spirochaetales bacterium]|nr:type I methionyl aminopeptidase [Spirochaetales bacterium]
MIQLKTAQDIALIREAGDILYKAIEAVRKSMVEGVTTRELDRILKNEIVKRGGRPAFLGYQGYPASLCISVNEEVIHGIPGNRKLENGDIVGLDVGVVFRERIADAAVTVGLGNVSAADRLLVRTTEECLAKALAVVRAGNRVRDISAAVYGHARSMGFEVVREYCGHGVGFSLHEDPQIYNYPAPGPNPKLRAGMVVAVEPMINAGTWKIKVLDDDWTVVTADGSKSAHFEHTVAVTEGEPEILTRW